MILLGIFVQPSFLQKITSVPNSPERERRFRPINFPLPDTSSVSSRIDSGNNFILKNRSFMVFVKV